MRFFPPIHTPESVALELLKGLEDGSITLGNPDSEAEARGRALQLDALRAEYEANRDRATAELIDFISRLPKREQTKIRAALAGTGQGQNADKPPTDDGA